MYQNKPRIPKEICRILETLCKDKWPPMQLGENCCDPIGGNYDINDKLCPELALSWENKFILLEFQIDNRLKELNENYKKCFK